MRPAIFLPVLMFPPMAVVTLRVLDGADRGRVFDGLPTPVTIGREEGNTVQMNDERVSRFHLKIQEDEGKVVLTDLESTNGTKVNGESVKVWMLRYGDVVSVGHTLLLYGSAEEIAQRLASLRGADLSAGVPLSPEEGEAGSPTFSLESELLWGQRPTRGPRCTRCCRPSCPATSRRARLRSSRNCFSICTSAFEGWCRRYEFRRDPTR